MSNATRFLSRLLGLYCLIIALAMLAQRHTTVATVAALLHDRPLMYVIGVWCLLAAGDAGARSLPLLRRLRREDAQAGVAAAARGTSQGYLCSTTARTGCVSYTSTID